LRHTLYNHFANFYPYILHVHKALAGITCQHFKLIWHNKNNYSKTNIYNCTTMEWIW